VKISELTAVGGNWRRFHLNVGGFTVKNCHWNSASGQIRFPKRYDQNGGQHKVVFAYGVHINRLRQLLASGETALPRDRRPCPLRIHFLGWSPHESTPWMIFNFTVRGFTILGCRWQPSTASIQLPVTFYFCQNPGQVGFKKKLLVCAYGAHIIRLRHALEEEFDKVYGHQGEEEPVAAMQHG
jgi:hypothetical protein